MKWIPPWLVEMWKENRQVFKTVVGDALLFFVLLGFLQLAHFGLLLLSPLPPERRELVETVHFRMFMGATLLGGLSLLLEVIISKVKRWRS